VQPSAARDERDKTETDTDSNSTGSNDPANYASISDLRLGDIAIQSITLMLEAKSPIFSFIKGDEGCPNTRNGAIGSCKAARTNRR